MSAAWAAGEGLTSPPKNVVQPTVAAAATVTAAATAAAATRHTPCGGPVSRSPLRQTTRVADDERTARRRERSSSQRRRRRRRRERGGAAVALCCTVCRATVGIACAAAGPRFARPRDPNQARDSNAGGATPSPHFAPRHPILT